MKSPTREWLRDVQQGAYDQSLESFSKAITTLSDAEFHKGDNQFDGFESTPTACQDHMLRAIEQFCVFARQKLRAAVDEQDTNGTLLANIAAEQAAEAETQDNQTRDARTAPRVNGSVPRDLGRLTNHHQTEVASEQAGLNISNALDRQTILGLWKLGYTCAEIAAVVGGASDDVETLVRASGTDQRPQRRSPK